MLFNSVHFVIFLPVVVGLHVLLPQRFRWMLLLVASYYFYMCWRPPYALVLLAVTVLDYTAALVIERVESKSLRRMWLLLSLSSNLGLLFFFKYFNFVTGSVNGALAWSGSTAALPVLDILLPIGISFHTFQSISYVIDVYRGKHPAERHFGIFALFIAFFPQLVAGPIERGVDLLPQFRVAHFWDAKRVEGGVKLVLWGLFKKVAIADRLAVYVNEVYGNSDHYGGGTLLVATYFFALQIYCDFSGYTDIATGAAQMLGYDFRPNFLRPYLASDIREFWARWHISLTSWFRDYVYVPLGGNRVGPRRWMANILVVFLLSGLWHGANWTYVIWGAIHALYFLLLRIKRSLLGEPAAVDSSLSSWLWRVASIVLTFHAVVLAWIFFRAETVTQATSIVATVLSPWWLEPVRLSAGDFGSSDLTIATVLIAILLVVEATSHVDLRLLLAARPRWQRWAFFYAVVLLLVNFGMFHSPQEFIYFQF